MTAQRKRIRLEQYDYRENGGYFITVCTEQRKPILGRVVDGTDFTPPRVQLSRLGSIAERYLLRIPELDQYVIMPNHVHLLLLLQNASASVPQIIRSWKTLVSKEAGFPLWQRSYYDHIIRNQADYDRVWTYIRDNPAKWNLDCYYNEA